MVALMAATRPLLGVFPAATQDFIPYASVPLPLYAVALELLCIRLI